MAKKFFLKKNKNDQAADKSSARHQQEDRTKIKKWERERVSFLMCAVFFLVMIKSCQIYTQAMKQHHSGGGWVLYFNSLLCVSATEGCERYEREKRFFFCSLAGKLPSKELILFQFVVVVFKAKEIGPETARWGSRVKRVINLSGESAVLGRVSILWIRAPAPAAAAEYWCASSSKLTIESAAVAAFSKLLLPPNKK